MRARISSGLLAMGASFPSSATFCASGIWAEAVCHGAERGSPGAGRLDAALPMPLHRGERIAAKGIYRDPVRSSRGHFVKASGLRWLCVMLLAPVPWAGCVWGLPFLTVLAPSGRFAAGRGIRFKKLTDWGRQALLQVARWLPGRRVVAVADGGFSAIAPLRDLAPHLAVVTRLRLDACLCRPPPARRPGRRGRPPVKGARLPSLAERLRDPRTPWRRVAVTGWYGRTTRRLDRHHDRHRALAPPRHAGGDPLGPRARPDRREGTA